MMNERRYPKKKVNELHAELQGLNSLNPFPGMVSGPRGAMTGSQLAQRVVHFGIQPRNIITGTEFELAKYTFGVRAMSDCEIIATIPRYPTSAGFDGIKSNPQLVVIVRKNNSEYDVINVEKYFSMDPSHGFLYNFNKNVSFEPGTILREGTVIADSPCVQQSGEFAFSSNVNVINISDPAVNQDGYLIAEELRSAFSFNTFEEISCEFGARKAPLNLYGTADNPKICPDIGDKVRDDRVLMAFRSNRLRRTDSDAGESVYDTALYAAAEQSIYQRMELCPFFDRPFYTSRPGGEVIDIQIYCNGSLDSLPGAYVDQIRKYHDATIKFHHEILNWYKRLKHREPQLIISPALSDLIRDSMAYVEDSKGNTNKPALMLVHKQDPIDTVRIKFTIKHTVTPQPGQKITDWYGSKGVIVGFKPRHEMHKDQYGQHADVVVLSNSTINRANPGRNMEQYINSNAVSLMRYVKDMLNIDWEINRQTKIKTLTHVSSHPNFEKAYFEVLDFYRCVNEDQYNLYAKASLKDKINNLMDCLEKVQHSHGISIHFPPDNPVDKLDMIRCIEQRPWAYKKGPVSFLAPNGQWVQTKDNVRIGAVAFGVLDKDASTWNAVASASTQGFGHIGRIPRDLRSRRPVRLQSTRLPGESETRSMIGYLHPIAVIELLDRSCNPATNEIQCETILGAQNPMTLEHTIDRTIHRYDGHRPLRYLKHVYECAGIKLVYERNVNYESSDSFGS